MGLEISNPYKTEEEDESFSIVKGVKELCHAEVNSL